MPIVNVAQAIKMMVVASTRCRPILSPSGPKKRPPNGRTTNETARTANDDSSAAVVLCVGKKALPIVAAA